MAKNRFVDSSVDELSAADVKQALFSKSVAVYYRQSTLGQVGNVSTDMQLEDLPAYARQLGWTDEQIKLIDLDKGFSGTLRSNIRPGLGKLFELIQSGTISAVIAQDVDRITRDEHGITGAQLMQHCDDHNVLFITPGGNFDFKQGRDRLNFNIRQFFAAEYRQQMVYDKMLPAKRRLVEQGVFSGGAVPLGFLVGKDRQYTPYKAMAETLTEWLKILINHKGVMRTAAGYIRENGPYLDWSNLESSVPVGYRLVALPSQKRNYPSSVQLENIASNPFYIGWHVYFTDWGKRSKIDKTELTSGGKQKKARVENPRKPIAKQGNHEPLIDSKVWWQAYNLISAVLPDGKPNPNYDPHPTRGRRAAAKYDKPKPLYMGMVGSYVDGEWIRATLKTYSVRDGDSSDDYDYSYTVIVQDSDRIASRKLWQKRYDVIDSFVTERLQARLFGTMAQKVIDTIQQTSKDNSAVRKQREKRIAALEREQQRLVDSVGKATIPDFITKLEDRYRAIGEEIEQTRVEITALDKVDGNQQRILKLKTDLSRLGENWDTLSRDEQLTAIEICISRINVWIDDYDDLNVTVRWRDSDNSDTCTMAKTKDYRGWLNRNVSALIAAMDRGADQVEIAAMFPCFTWKKIAEKYHYATEKWPKFDKLPIKGHESYTAYRQRTGEIDSCENKSTYGGKSQDTCLLDLDLWDSHSSVCNQKALSPVKPGEPFNIAALLTARPQRAAIAAY
jgi:DNA invertase Pin-like site-specific DNA recombinase